MQSSHLINCDDVGVFGKTLLKLVKFSSDNHTDLPLVKKEVHDVGVDHSLGFGIHEVAIDEECNVEDCGPTLISKENHTLNKGGLHKSVRFKRNDISSRGNFGEDHLKRYCIGCGANFWMSLPAVRIS